MIFGQFIASKIRFFLKNHAQNAMEILFPDPFLKDKKAVYIYGMPSRGLEHIETKLQTTCFYLT